MSFVRSFSFKALALTGAMIGALVVGCAGDDDSGDQAPILPSNTPPAVDTGKPMANPPNPATCSNVTRSGAPVPYSVMWNSQPVALGGAILPGEYVLKEVVVYNTATDIQLPADNDPDNERPRLPVDTRIAQKNIVMAKDHFRQATGDGTLGEAGYAKETLSAGWYTIDGTNLKVTNICPARGETAIPYTATPYQLILFPTPDTAEFYYPK